MAVANAYFRNLDWMWPNFLHYVAVFYRAKWLILGVTFISALVGVGYAVTTTNQYRATVVMIPAQRDTRLGSRQLARAADLFAGLGGGLADALDVSAGTTLKVALATLRSRDFLTRFAERHQFRRMLRKPSDFDPDASDPDEIRDPPLLQYAFQTLMDTHRQFRKRLDLKAEELMRKLYTPYDFDWEARKRDIPVSNGIHNRLRRIISIERKPREGLINVSVRWKDPVVAAEWANALIADLNSVLRDTAIAQSRKRIAYLNRQLDKTSVIPLQQAIYRLIETETRTIMVAETRTDYAFKVIDPAVPPRLNRPIRPKRGTLIKTTAFMGFTIAVFAVILLDYARILRRQGEGSPAAR